MSLFKKKSPAAINDAGAKPTSLPMALGMAKRKKLNAGGKVAPSKDLMAIEPSAYTSDKTAGYPKMSDGGSVSERIMRKRKMMADGGMTTPEADEDEKNDMFMKKMSDGGTVELDNEEEPAEEDFNKMDANAKELYDDEQLSDQPLESKGHSEEDQHDMDIVSAIRRKLTAKRGM